MQEPTHPDTETVTVWGWGGHGEGSDGAVGPGDPFRHPSLTTGTLSIALSCKHRP